MLYDSNYHILTAKLLGMDTPILAIPTINEIPSQGYQPYTSLLSLGPLQLILFRGSLFGFPFRDRAIPPASARRHPNNAEREPTPQMPPPSQSDGDPSSEQVDLSPITEFSWRSIFIVTNLLRIMQKIVKRKPYRNLQMVQMKFTLLLRKQFKIPNESVAYYILKIVKGQVPYSGRKWRQRINLLLLPHLMFLFVSCSGVG